MHPANFRWLSDVEIEIDGTLCDLHNCYDLKSFNFENDNTIASVSMHWEKNAFAFEDRPSSIRLHFEDVNHFRINPRDPAYPPKEDTCLREFALDREDWPDGPYHYSTSDQFTAETRWAFCFQSEMMIVIGSKIVRLKTT